MNFLFLKLPAQQITLKLSVVKIYNVALNMLPSHWTACLCLRAVSACCDERVATGTGDIT